MFAWFLTHGYGREPVVADCGIDVGGGRVPDLTVWARGLPSRPARSTYASTSGLMLAVEVVSPGSEVVDRITKKVEYAKAGIPRYWFVECDGGNAVYRYTLTPDTGEYDLVDGGAQPLAWLLTTVPDVS